MTDGPYRGFVELPLAVLDALRESLAAVVEHVIGEQERVSAPHRPILLDVMNYDPVEIFWRGMAPKARLKWWRASDRRDTCAEATCNCGRRAAVSVSEQAMEDCHDSTRGLLIASVLKRLARAVSNCHCVNQWPRS